jgi:hypothetical protein
VTSVENPDSKSVYTDPWFSVRQDNVRRSDGSRGVYSEVDTADCSLVIRVDGARVHLVEQAPTVVRHRCDRGGIKRTNGRGV